MAFVQFTDEKGGKHYLIGPLGNLDSVNPRIGQRSQSLIKKGGNWIGPYSSEGAKGAAQSIRFVAKTTGDGFHATALAIDDNGQPLEEVKSANAPVLQEAVTWRGVTPYRGQDGFYYHRFQVGENFYSIKGRTPQDVIGQLQLEIWNFYTNTLPPENESTVPAASASPSETSSTPVKVLRPADNVLREGELPARPAAPESSELDRRERAYQKAMIELTTAQIKEAAKRDPEFASWLANNMF